MLVYKCISISVCIHQVENDTASEPLVQKAYWGGGSVEGEK